MLGAPKINRNVTSFFTRHYQMRLMNLCSLIWLSSWRWRQKYLATRSHDGVSFLFRRRERGAVALPAVHPAHHWPLSIGCATVVEACAWMRGDFPQTDKISLTTEQQKKSVAGGVVVIPSTTCLVSSHTPTCFTIAQCDCTNR